MYCVKLSVRIERNYRFTISHLDDVKWYIFINIHITILEIYMYHLVIANLNIMHPSMYFGISFNLTI